MKAIINVLIFMYMVVLTNSNIIAGKWSCSNHWPELPEMINDFPLKKGAYWVYNGFINLKQDGTEQEIPVNIKMEVLDVIQRGYIKGFLIRGFYQDLFNYIDGLERQNYVLIQVNGRFYELGESVWDVLLEEFSSLEGIINDQTLLLDLPLWENKRFGDIDGLANHAIGYSWYVEEVFIQQLSGILGVSPYDERTVYSLVYDSTGSRFWYRFVPGIGFTGFGFGHNGSMNDFNIRLVEYHPGS